MFELIPIAAFALSHLNTSTLDDPQICSLLANSTSRRDQTELLLFVCVVPHVAPDTRCQR